jgi:hypothetical protein
MESFLIVFLCLKWKKRKKKLLIQKRENDEKLDQEQEQTRVEFMEFSFKSLRISLIKNGSFARGFCAG